MKFTMYYEMYNQNLKPNVPNSTSTDAIFRNIVEPTDSWNNRINKLDKYHWYNTILIFLNKQTNGDVKQFSAQISS